MKEILFGEDEMSWIYDQENEKWLEPKRHKRRRTLKNKQNKYFKQLINRPYNYFGNVYSSWFQPYYYTDFEYAINEQLKRSKTMAKHPKKPCSCCCNPRSKISYESGRPRLTIQERKILDSLDRKSVV